TGGHHQCRHFGKLHFDHPLLVCGVSAIKKGAYAPSCVQRLTEHADAIADSIPQGTKC
ncbi:hypothetical protein HMPREF3224_02193, partial [Anaerococcus hydrogenalis]